MGRARAAGYRLAIAEGGTFTDVVVGDADGKLTGGKGLTDREQPYRGFEIGLEDAAQTLGVNPAELLAPVGRVLHSL